MPLAMMGIRVLLALHNFCDLLGHFPDQAQRVRINRRSINLVFLAASLPVQPPGALRGPQDGRTSDRNCGLAAR